MSLKTVICAVFILLIGITGCAKLASEKAKPHPSPISALPPAFAYPVNTSVGDMTIAIDPQTSPFKNQKFFDANLWRENILVLSVIYDNNGDNTYSIDKSDILLTNPTGQSLQRITTDHVIKGVKKTTYFLEQSIPEKRGILPQSRGYDFLFYTLPKDVNSLERYNIRLLIYVFEEKVKKEVNMTLKGNLDIVRQLK